MMQRKFQGVWIPADLWLDRSLSFNEKVMLVEIASLQDDERGCYASNGYFAEFFGLSNSRVSEIISGLKDKGLINVEFIKQGKQVIERQIRLVTPFGNPKTPSENTENPIRKTEGGYSEKAKGNNTLLNNTYRDNNTLPGFEIEAVLTEAFEVFWSAGMVKTGKKKAFTVFASLVKRDKVEPKAFAEKLAADVKARIEAEQFGFDKLHPTTYLNQERWNDDLPAKKETGRFKPRHHGLDRLNQDIADDIISRGL